jgi:subtilisin family serine protease
VAGTIGVGNTDNAVGLADINWPVRVISVRVLGRCGGAFSDITDGIRWAAGIEVDGHVNPTPAEIINMSLGAPISCSERPDMQSAIDDAVAAGALVVVAAGNSRRDVEGYSPSGCDNVLSVAAADARGRLAARYSNFGNKVALLAPGGDVQRDDNGDGKPDGVLSYGNPGDSDSGPYVFYNGTSMAAPHVAGAAALLLAQNPELSATDVRQLLVDNARPRTDAECPQPCGAGLLSTDIDAVGRKSGSSEDGELVLEDAAAADNSQVTMLGGQEGAAQIAQDAASVLPEALAGTGFSYRHDWGDRKGQWKLNLNWGSIHNNSRVFAAIGECRPGGGKFIGGARYTLHNVAPRNGVVSVWVDVQWNDPIRLCVDYLVVNP